MAKLKIIKFGDPILRKVSRPVEEITPRIQTLIDDMIETMRDAGGCGLAAVQVGVLRHIGDKVCLRVLLTNGFASPYMLCTPVPAFPGVHVSHLHGIAAHQ